MKIVCPGCKRAFEMEHLERGRKVQCQCSCKFLLDDQSVLEDYSAIDEPPPSRIGPCEIERFIGKGGMGKVYKGRHPALGIPVAVKTLLPEYAADRAFKIRFIKSAKICAQVDHPNIVRIYDCAEDSGCVYLILEYIGGGSVQRMIEKHGPLPFETICDVAIAVCRGLAEATRHGIVHRDVKPENIMRSHDGEFKLSDLGLAKQRSEDPKRLDPTLTMAFASLGTPQYMPPEQAIDARSCDCRADIYSLGVSLYEMACGRLPFDSKDPLELRRLHDEKEPEPPSKLREGLPPDLEAIILKCLRKRREDRYQSPEELLEEFLALKEGRPLPSALAEAERLEEAAKARRRKFRGRLLLAAGAVAALAALPQILRRYAPPKPQEEVRPNASVQPLKAPDARKTAASAKAPGDDPVALRRAELWKYACGLADKALQAKDSFDAAIANLRAFTEDEDSREFAPEAARRIEELSAAKAQATSKLLDSLAEQAKAPLAAQDFAKAAALYENYAGPLARDSAAQRQSVASAHREAARKLEERRKAEQEAAASRGKELLDACAAALLAGKEPDALALASGDEAQKLQPELKPLLSALEKAPNAIAESFAAQLGSQIYLSLGGEKAFVTVRKIEGASVYAEEAVDKSSLLRRFDASSLSLPERLARLSGQSFELKSLYGGLELLKAGAPEEALAYFKRSGALGQALGAKLERSLEEKASREAQAKLLEILASCSFPLRSLPSPEELPSLGAWLSLPPEAAEKTKAALSGFLFNYGSTSFGQLYADAVKEVVAKLEGQAAAPEAKPAAKEKDETTKAAPRPVRKPPFKIQSAEDLNKELIRFNPGYFGDGLVEFSQARGFAVDLTGQNVSNLEPLRGLPVRTLILNATAVGDLSPLKGLPLENLQFASSKASDLKPLEGMQLKCLAFSPEMASDPAGIQAVRRMKSLETIGFPEGGALKFMPAKEFWEAFDLKAGRR